MPGPKSPGPMKGNDLAELAILRRAQSGERHAFDLLVIKYQAGIFSLLSRYTRNSADAEDALQETFLKAYSGLKQFRCESAFYTWLYRIAINSASSLLRARARSFAGPTWEVLARPGDLAQLPLQLREVGTPEQ